MWDVLAHPWLNFNRNCTTVEVRECMSNYIPLFYVTTYRIIFRNDYGKAVLTDLVSYRVNIVQKMCCNPFLYIFARLVTNLKRSDVYSRCPASINAFWCIQWRFSFEWWRLGIYTDRCGPQRGINRCDLIQLQYICKRVSTKWRVLKRLKRCP